MSEQTVERTTVTEEPNFEGHEGRECGEHRTVGSHRAWCFNCSEWCYPAMPCLGCERPMLCALLREWLHNTSVEANVGLRDRTAKALA